MIHKLTIFSFKIGQDLLKKNQNNYFRSVC